MTAAERAQLQWADSNRDAQRPRHSSLPDFAAGLASVIGRAEGGQRAEPIAPPTQVVVEAVDEVLHARLDADDCPECRGNGWVPGSRPVDGYTFSEPCSVCGELAAQAERINRGRLPASVVGAGVRKGWLTASPAVAEHRHAVSSWLQAWTAQSAPLVLAGPSQVGKTWVAAAVALYLAKRGASVRWLYAPKMFDGDRSGRVQLVEWALSGDLLVLDDVGAEGEKPWAPEVYEQALRRRLDRERRAVIVTSNLPPESLEAQVGSRAWERARFLGAVVCEVNGAGPARGCS